ncbi:hypothetical protein WJX77_005568 [Trebouxia sp. C0004]
MSDLIFNIPSAFLTLGPVLARGANGVTLYKADLQQGQRSLQVAVKQFNISGASAAAERQFEKEVHIAQVASASCQRACRMLGCCKLDGNTCLVMSLYLSSAANRIEVLQGKAPLYHLKAKPAVMSGASQVELQEDVGTVKADIQQAKQDLRAAEATGDEKAVAFQRKQLEQLREKELILLRAQTAGPSDAWREEYKRDMAQLDTNLRALINRPSVISTTTLQELGALANKKPKVVAKVPFRSQSLSQECAVVQSLQGIFGIPNLLHDQCVGDSILMRPVLDPLAPGAFFVYNLHNSLPLLVQMLKAAHCKLVINRDVSCSVWSHYHGANPGCLQEPTQGLTQ